MGCVNPASLLRCSNAGRRSSRNAISIVEQRGVLSVRVSSNLGNVHAQPAGGFFEP